MILMLICAAALAFGLISSRRYRGKYTGKGTAKPGILALLLPPVLGICACCLCLIGSTYAWFTANISASTQTLQGAYYDVTVEVQLGESLISPDGNGVYSLSSQTGGKGYTVTLTASGTASTGFCKVVIGSENGKALYTEQIVQGESLSFTLYPSANNENCSFAAMWGACPGEPTIKDGDTLGTPSEEPAEEATEETQPEETGPEGNEADNSAESTESGEEAPDDQAQTPTAEESTDTEAAAEPQPEAGEQTAAEDGAEDAASESETPPENGGAESGPDEPTEN